MTRKWMEITANKKKIYSQKLEMSENKSNFCGEPLLIKKRCCFDDKMNQSNWDCSDNNKHKRKHKNRCVCKEKKEEKHVPFDRCKCKDFKVVYFVPKFFLNEVENENIFNNNINNNYKNNNRHSITNEHRNFNKQASAACGCRRII